MFRCENILMLFLFVCLIRMFRILRKSFRFCLSYYRNIFGAVTSIIIVLVFYIKYNNWCQNALIELSNEAKKFMHCEKTHPLDSINATVLRHWIQTNNAQEKILNLEIFGPLKSDTLIFVVQVDKYSCNFNSLVASLYELKGIQDVFIIFSHSYFDSYINSLIRSIDFCRILQLFYPYSIQAYPDRFPGYNEKDCPPSLNMEVAIKLNCTGAQYADIHGRYRNPVHAEKKHKWWWTANKVFADLSCTDGHKGMVVFLEYDHFLIRDFIYITHRMKTIADSLPQCDLLSLGTPSILNGNNLHRVEFTTWDPKYHSNVLAMDIYTWNSIESHYDLFCLIDDYSWSRSLLYVSLNRRDGKRFKVLSSVAPRALQITSCPCIGEMMNCGVMDCILNTLSLQNRYKEKWFPPYIEVYSNIELDDDDEYIILDHMENNGGWNDSRDKQLCSNITINKAKTYLINMDQEFIEYRASS